MYSPTTPFSEYLRGEQLKYPELKLEDIEKLKQSLANNPSLPPISDKKYLAFLHSCEFDLELAKKTVKNYYNFHFDIPQVFCELDPLADYMEKNYNCSSVCHMPLSNDDKSQRILYMQFKDYNADAFDFVSLYKRLLMWMEYTLMTYGTCDGFIIVLDSKGLSWRHIVKIPLGITTKMLKFLETALPIRLNSIHVLNSGMATQMLLKLVQRIARQELMDKIKIHVVGSQDIFNYVPKKVMPLEIGGEGKSQSQYSDELCRNIIDHCDLFYAQNEMLNNHMMYMNEQYIEDNE